MLFSSRGAYSYIYTIQYIYWRMREGNEEEGRDVLQRMRWCEDSIGCDRNDVCFLVTFALQPFCQRQTLGRWNNPVRINWSLIPREIVPVSVPELQGWHLLVINWNTENKFGRHFLFSKWWWNDIFLYYLHQLQSNVYTLTEIPNLTVDLRWLQYRTLF